jgi:hypothetical protein
MYGRSVRRAIYGFRYECHLFPGRGGGFEDVVRKPPVLPFMKGFDTPPEANQSDISNQT